MFLPNGILFSMKLTTATFSECYEIICIYCTVPGRKKQALAGKSHLKFLN